MQFILNQDYPYYSWYHILIDYIGLFLNSFFLLYLLDKCFGLKKHLVHKKFILFSSISISTLCFIIGGELSNHKGYIYYTTFICVGIFFSMILFQNSLYNKFICVMLYTSSVITINGLVEITIYMILNQPKDVLLSVPVFTLLFFIKRIGEYILVYYLVRFIIHYSPKNSFSIPKIYWASYLTLILLSVIKSYLDIPPMLKNLSYLLNLLILLLTNLSIYYFFYSSVMQYNIKLKYSLENQQLLLEQKHLAEINQVYEDMRQLRHELKNHIFCMDILLSDKNYTELEQYFSQLKEATPISRQMDFGSHSINALLNSKIELAKTKGIEFCITAKIPASLKIKEFDLCSILGNLCDNAIEASEHNNNKWIVVNIFEYGNYLSITVTNYVNSNVLSENPALSTTKKDKKVHGLGVEIIKKLAQKYDGIVLFKTEGNKFVASVQLKN